VSSSDNQPAGLVAPTGSLESAAGSKVVLRSVLLALVVGIAPPVSTTASMLVQISRVLAKEEGI